MKERVEGRVRAVPTGGTSRPEAGETITGPRRRPRLPVGLMHNGGMDTSHEQAVQVQRRHESHIMALPGVTGIGVKLRDGRLVLEVTVAPDTEIPAELQVPEVDGLPLVVEKRRYEPQ